MKRKLFLLLALVGLLVSLVACSNDGQSSAESSEEGGPVELTFWTFPGSGLNEQIAKYEEENPNVKVKIQEADYADHHTNLVTALSAGSGAPDVTIIETEYIERLKQTPDQFYNLNDYGAADIKDDYLDWRWKEASSTDGSFVLGIPTDVGPMSMAYRVDLFEEAGLPTDPAEVSAQLDTWEAYVEAGRQLKEETGSNMFNTAADLFRVVREQGTEQYFDAEGNLIIEESAQIEKAWNLAIDSLDIQAGIDRETTEWGAALARGDFATVFLPPWMMQQIIDNAPDTAGKWNVAQIPEASGNWGGSLLSIPAQSDHPEEAYKLISWLLSPEKQLEIFKEKGNFPSTPAVYEDAAVQEYKNDFFIREDLGSMLAEAAQRVEYVYRSPMTSPINTIMDDTLTSIVDGSATPEEAWKNAVEEIERQIARQ